MKTRKVQIASEEVEYDIIRSARRTVALYVRPGGTLLIRAPWYIPAYVLMRFVQAKATWIIRQRESLARIPVSPEKTEFSDGATTLFLGKDILIKASLKNRNSVILGDSVLHVSGPAIDSPAKIKALIEGWYLTEARKHLIARTQELASLHRDSIPQPKSVNVRKMKRRWGTCRANGAIWYNRELIKKDQGLIDAVIMHELCHLVHPNHSRRFYDLVEELMPGYRQLRKELRNV